MKIGLVGCVALLSVGCGPAFVFKAAGPERPAKPQLCEFEVVTTEPPAPQQKIGNFDIQYDNTGFIDNHETLKRKIQPHVCRVGGDAVLPHANSYGTYTKVSVFAAPGADGEASAESSGDEDTEQSADGLAGL